MKQKNQLGIASIPAINQYLAQAKSEGIDVGTILREMSLNEAIFTDNSRHITGAQFQTLITALLQCSGNPLFGLHSSRFVRPDSYSILGFIAVNCSTFDEAIRKIQPFEQLVGDMGITKISHGATTTQIQWHCQYTEPAVVRQMVDNCLSSWLAFTRTIIGPKYHPKHVLLRQPSPSLQTQQQYQTVFSCPVLFNQIVDALVIDNALLSVPLTHADPARLGSLESQAHTQLKLLSQLESTSEKVAMLVGAQLNQGLPKRALIAAQLNMSEKTLQRRLKAQKTHYLAVLDKVRLARVEELLNLPGLSLVQISQLSGFSEPRSFYRWFKQITGHSPRHSEEKNARIKTIDLIEI